MLSQYIRVFKSSGSTLTDMSNNMQIGTATTIPTATTDYLYIGQHFPFNNLYFQVSTAATGVSGMNIEYWDGTAWQTMVDVIDGTRPTNKTYATSGVVQFAPDKDYTWNIVRDTTQTGEPTELASIELYNLYWIRISATATLSGSPALTRLSYMFALSNQLAKFDPTIDNYLIPWGGSTKTSWDDQLMLASEKVVSDLKARGLIWNRGQILRMDDVNHACIHRALAFIYVQLGSSHAMALEHAMSEYKASLNIKRFSFDLDSNARLDQSELAGPPARLVR